MLLVNGCDLVFLIRIQETFWLKLNVIPCIRANSFDKMSNTEKQTHNTVSLRCLPNLVLHEMRNGEV